MRRERKIGALLGLRNRAGTYREAEYFLVDCSRSEGFRGAWWHRDKGLRDLDGRFKNVDEVRGAVKADIDRALGNP